MKPVTAGNSRPGRGAFGSAARPSWIRLRRRRVQVLAQVDDVARPLTEPDAVPLRDEALSLPAREEVLVEAHLRTRQVPVVPVVVPLEAHVHGERVDVFELKGLPARVVHGRVDDVATRAEHVLVTRAALEVVGARIEVELPSGDAEVDVAVGASGGLLSRVDADLNGFDLGHLVILPRGGGPVRPHRRRTR